MGLNRGLDKIHVHFEKCHCLLDAGERQDIRSNERVSRVPSCLLLDCKCQGFHMPIMTTCITLFSDGRRLVGM